MNELVVIRFRADSNTTAVIHLDESGGETSVSKHAPGPDFWVGIAGALQDEIDAGYINYAFDLERVEGVMSRDWASLIRLWKLVGEAGGCAVVVQASPRIKEISKVLRLERMFHFCDTLTEARKYCAQYESEAGPS